MKKGKNILAQFTFLIAILLSSQPLFAQGGMGGRGGGMGGSGGGMGGSGGVMGGPGGSSSSGEVISSKNMLTSTGLFMIKYDKAVNKIKVRKRDRAKREAVELFFETYRAAYENILIAYSSQINSILMEEEKSSGRNSSGNSGNSSNMQRGERGSSGQNSMSSKMAAMKQLTVVAKPMHDNLNQSLSRTLSAKQIKRWNKYYIKLCDKNYVGKIESRSSSRGGGMSSGGMGGPGGMSGGGMRR